MPNLPGNKLFRCGAGDGQSCIDAYGRIQACLELRAPELVLQRGTSLKNAQEYFKGLREMITTNPEYVERCGKCFLKNLCEQCPAKAWPETGTLDTPVQYLCDVTHAIARQLGWLGENELAWQVEDWKNRIQPRS